jgi:hypothetical protein
MRSEFRAYLLADTGVAAIVATRVSWTWREQGTPLPALVLTKTDGADDVVLEGTSGFVDGHVQADCFASTQLSATQLAKAVRTACTAANVGNTGGVIQGAFVMHEADEFEGEAPDRIFRTRLALRIPYLET